jgi:hypothetical protein
MATSAFGKAFRAAREAGDKEFEFGGKKYNTKLKEEDSAPAKKAAPTKDTSNYSNEGRSSAAPAKLEKDYPRKITGFPGSSSMVAAQRRSETEEEDTPPEFGTKKPTPFPGSSALKMAKGGAVRSSASSRADGIAKRGKTKGRIC